jgi:hypothetical protein
MRCPAPVAVLAARGASGLDVYGWLGSLATYGFIVAYALVCIALPATCATTASSVLERRSFPGWLRRHAARAGRKLISGPRRTLRQAALHLSRLFDRRTALVRAQQTLGGITGAVADKTGSVLPDTPCDHRGRPDKTHAHPEDQRQWQSTTS